jgi:hypothetical protein
MRSKLPAKHRALAALVGVGLTSLSLPSAGHEPDPSKYSYWKDVYPILRDRCAGCHIPGGAGPMSLFRYEEAFPWAAAIKMEVLEGRMPPWLPEEGQGEHRGERRLTANEIEVLVDWAIGGAPEGARPLSPPVLEAESGWKLGEPDRVLEPTEESRLSAAEVERTHCWVASIENRRPIWVSAIDFRPGNPGIVRAARVDLGGSCPVGPGTRPLLTWAPAQEPFPLPQQAAELLPKNARLAVTIHYRKSWRDDGKELRDRSRVGLYFARTHRRLEARHVERSSWRTEEDIELLSVFPDFSEGEPIQIDALLPDGETLPLLQIRTVRPEWLTKYFFRKPLRLPGGSEIRVSPPGAWFEHFRTRE